MSVDVTRLKATKPRWDKKDLNVLTTRMNKELPNDRALIIGIEELSELTQAVTKFMRFSSGKPIINGSRYARNRRDVLEEMADVVIAIDIFKNHLGIGDKEFNQMLAYKINAKFSKLNNGEMVN